MTSAVLGSVTLLLVLILFGWHIALALTISTFIGVYLIFGNLHVVLSLFASTAFEALRDYVFAVIPLFVLMGEFIARSGAASDLYRFMDRALRGVPGRHGVATVGGNAVFAAVTGVSIASAAAFTKIAYPQMVRFGYSKQNAISVITGSACLGMLIPPSVLLIIWGVLTEESIGSLFIAGVLPGLLVSVLFIAYVVVASLLRPQRWGGMMQHHEDEAPSLGRRELIGVFLILFLIALVIGGIWGGLFTPTEAAAVGAIGGLVVALVKGTPKASLWQAVTETGRLSAPILLLLIVGQFYSRLLAMGGITNIIQDSFGGAALSPWLLLAAMVCVWFILGMLLDSASILLLTVPLFAPLAKSAGWDPLAFAIMGVLAIETGLLTPPFGLLIFAVKTFLNDQDVTLGMIFTGTVPYWIMLLVTIVFVGMFPWLATWLPRLMVS